MLVTFGCVIEACRVFHRGQRDCEKKEEKEKKKRQREASFHALSRASRNPSHFYRFRTIGFLSVSCLFSFEISDFWSFFPSRAGESCPLFLFFFFLRLNPGGKEKIGGRERLEIGRGKNEPARKRWERQGSGMCLNIGKPGQFPVGDLCAMISYSKKTEGRNGSVERQPRVVPVGCARASVWAQLGLIKGFLGLPNIASGAQWGRSHSLGAAS